VAGGDTFLPSGHDDLAAIFHVPAQPNKSAF
jgi:hypothetical protein